MKRMKRIYGRTGSVAEISSIVEARELLGSTRLGEHSLVNSTSMGAFIAEALKSEKGFLLASWWAKAKNDSRIT